MPTPEEIQYLTSKERSGLYPGFETYIMQSPLCPQLEERWQRLAHIGHITSEGVILYKNTHLARIYSGWLVGDRKIFTDPLRVQNGLVLIKNPLGKQADYGETNGLVILPSEITINGLDPLNGLLFTVKPSDKHFIIGRPVNLEYQKPLAWLYKEVLRRMVVSRIPPWESRKRFV